MLRIFRKTVFVVTKHPDSPIYKSSFLNDDEWQELFEGEWKAVPIVYDAESRNKAEAAKRLWEPTLQVAPELIL